MELFPAVDLIDGKCVRLTQGNYDQVKEFGDPIETVSNFVAGGATNLHIVDLMAAKTGTLSQLETIEKIRNTFSDLFIECGGGIRDLNRINILNDIGINRMIISTIAVTDSELTRSAIEQFRGKIALGFDTKNSYVAVKGWVQKTELTVEMALAPYRDLSLDISAIIVTDVAKDGMLLGPNFDQLESVLSVTDIPLVASGGISTVKDLIKLKTLSSEDRKVYGSIVGLALYEKTIDLKEAVELCRR